MAQIPPIFTKTPWIDRDGHLTPEAEQYNDQNSQYINKVLSPHGFEIPQNTTVNINNFANPGNPSSKPNGTIWYDSDIHKYKGKENGVVVIFTTTPA